jgi:exodeoxyribonuclease VII small subunit
MNELDEVTFEEALEELEEIVNRLERDALTLEETVVLYRRGKALAERGQRLLDDVELRVRQLASDGKGEYVEDPFPGEG